jgi:hypothetical protein
MKIKNGRFGSARRGVITTTVCHGYWFVKFASSLALGCRSIGDIFRCGKNVLQPSAFRNFNGSKLQPARLSTDPLIGMFLDS